MKKKICLLMGVMMVALTACGTTAPADNAGTGSSQQTESTQEAATEASTQEASAGETTAEVTEGPEHPEYLVVSEYKSSFYDGDYTEDAEGNSLENKVLFQGKAQAIMVSENSKDKYPDLYNTVNSVANSYLDAAASNAEEYAKQANDDLEASVEGEYPFFGPYAEHNAALVTRADDKALSMINNYYGYYGGAHGIYGITGDNYEVQSGKALSLSDVMSINEEELNAILKKKILETGDEENFWDLDDTLASYKYNPQNTDTDNPEYNYTWYMDYDGIHFYFAPYEIAAYAFGATDVVLGYDEVAGAVKEEYVPDKSKGYVVGLDLPTYSQENDDDNSDLHFVYVPDDGQEDESEYIMCKSLGLKIKDKSAFVDEYFDYNYDMQPISAFKIVTADGKEYVYAKVLTFNDYTDLLVFDITGGDVKYVGTGSYHMGYARAAYDKDGEIIITSPDNMSFGTTRDMLGTFTCYGKYKVGPDGMPQQIGNTYDISWISEDIKSKKDIEVSTIDEKGNETGKTTLPSGSHITPIRTDGAKYIDCKLDDGSYIRINYSNDSYPYQIGGQNVDDLFDGLLYAG